MKLMQNLSVYNIIDCDEDIDYFDLVIVCSSFEDRCIRGSNILSEMGTKIDNSIIFNFKETDPESRKITNLDSLSRNLSLISNHSFVYNSESVSKPEDGIKHFIEFFIENDIDFYGKKILVDISVMPKSYYFLLFKMLYEMHIQNSIYVMYTEPGRYKEPTNGQYLLTEGLDIVKSIPGYNGSNLKENNA